MKISYTKTETRAVTIEVPSYFAYDGTKRGSLVDLLYAQIAGHKIDFENGIPEARVRNSLYSDEAAKVEFAVETLGDLYKKADQIMRLLGIENE